MKLHPYALGVHLYLPKAASCNTCDCLQEQVQPEHRAIRKYREADVPRSCPYPTTDGEPVDKIQPPCPWSANSRAVFSTPSSRSPVVQIGFCLDNNPSPTLFSSLPHSPAMFSWDHPPEGLPAILPLGHQENPNRDKIQASGLIPGLPVFRCLPPPTQQPPTYKPHTKAFHGPEHRSC